MIRVPIIFFMVLFVVLHFDTVHNAPTDVAKSKEVPPLIFPTDPSKFRIPESTNSTALQILQNSQGKQRSKAAKPVQDTVNPKDDVETLESMHEMELPSQPEEQYGAHLNNHILMSGLSLDDDSVVDLAHDQSTDVAILTATTLAVLCVCAILGALIWRKIVQRKYGMRERLVTEDYFTLEK